jgi:hypothetical protein
MLRRGTGNQAFSMRLGMKCLTPYPFTSSRLHGFTHLFLTNLFILLVFILLAAMGFPSGSCIMPQARQA